ncbi:MAG: hypothetical protein RM022_016875 [Nostoc sp. EfeVER01]|uniref:hypothetical protein n=1 Tax=unclassified Nostoc TaxID=2593658 RepID=UPI002AD469ED|nr:MULTISPECIES: hypothetical protein [unclassified Nostoc]MDZ7944949.1 hypothetical protein [Nostoc sp. EfeVER01]MDZ7992598.1 hypothetical protein [Nostoc sp. EspVER01]
MQKYECVVLLPLTLKETGTNPVGYPLMVFECDPNLTEGERRTLRYQESKDNYIQFDALVVKRSQYSKNDTNIISYLFEIVDRDLALKLAQIVKNNIPDTFEEENFIP